jgi:clan AA aspartic protease
MTSGQMDGRQATVGVLFRIPGQPGIEIEFVIDTGFQGDLCLPEAAVVALGLTFAQELDTSLADDSIRQVDVYLATIEWEGTTRDVEVLAMGRRPLLGTKLLADKELVAQFRPGGMVTIDEI